MFTYTITLFSQSLLHDKNARGKKISELTLIISIHRLTSNNITGKGGVTLSKALTGMTNLQHLE